VVDAEDVDERHHPAHPLGPPAVAGACQRVPVVERVPPFLTTRVKGVGRGAGDDLVDGQEQVGVPEMVAAAVGDVDRRVADDADVTLCRVVPQVAPLPLEANLTLELAGVCLPVGCPVGLALAKGDELSGRDTRLRLGEQPVPAGESGGGRIR
jgi:hypothetical protein